jgi:hypothetical protein
LPKNTRSLLTARDQAGGGLRLIEERQANVAVIEEPALAEPGDIQIDEHWNVLGLDQWIGALAVADSGAEPPMTFRCGELRRGRRGCGCRRIASRIRRLPVSERDQGPQSRDFQDISECMHGETKHRSNA